MTRWSGSRRPGARRYLPPRPETATQPAAEAVRSAAGRRPQRLVERDMQFLAGELRRVASVTGLCIGLLTVLVLIDRLR